jgi:hypothetical protein
MSAEQSRLRQEQREEQKAEQIQGSAQLQRSADAGGKEFATVEELLRYDSEQNPVPPEVAERLGQTLANEPKAEKPWYKRILGN